MRACIYATGDTQDINKQIQQCRTLAQKLNATTISYRSDNGNDNCRLGLTELLKNAVAGKYRFSDCF